MTVDHREQARLEALRRYGSDDVPAEDELLALVRLAATVSGLPTATLNLLEQSVQLNYATHGFVGGSCDLQDSLCVIALREQAPLHVPDARLDPRFASSPWVDGRLDGIRLYASSPLMTPDGWMIGTLCVFDAEPGELPPQVLRALDDLAGLAMALLERRRLVRRAQEATRAKSAFLAAVSHEIRTPMQGVLGGLDLVLRDELPEPVRRHAALARRSAGALLVLVDDVLQLSQGEVTGLALHPRPFDPASLVADVGNALGVLAERKGLALVTDVEAAAGAEVVGDPDRIRQVLVNLVGNAVKFTTAGRVELSLARTCRDGVAELVMTVRDTGEGIAAEDLPNLFTPFTQGSSGHRHGGTGLGLSICAQVADLMGGRLEIASVPGEGSAFTFCVGLPVAETPEADRPDQPDCGAVRVLVADDSELNQLVTLAQLEALGAEVHVVGDGFAAVAQAAAGCFDVVLLDHEMPGLDGPGAAREIRKLGGLAGRLPLYALTGRVSAADRDACLAAGMDGVLAKPLDPALLARTLAGVAADRGRAPLS